ncbi:dynamin family protein [Pseudonocardia xishanensis]|uniref:Dynamin N-terminal domain-containing protein n=1 Tax=Pseudonocardia xishanensis TaxID=630995 RepID=A0ABP8RTK2_9PSEU
MSPLTPVVGRVLKLANEVHGLARSAERADVADALAEQAARWTDSAATVVVAGAQKRGKSRLVNALVGRPGLMPVDADLATHTQVCLRHGDGLRVVVHRTTEAPDGTRRSVETEIGLEQLPAFASGAGDPRILREVTGVEVTLDDSLLEGLRLVDTPGIDGLTLGHRHATTAALRRADALLFTVSAQDQPILRHELEFLADAAARLPTVAFVLTKVEDSISADALLDENRARLAHFVGPRGADLDPAVGRRLLDAPWLPVSATLGEASAALAAAGHSERARARAERSGLPALRAHLRGVADRRELVRATGVLAVTAAGLRALAAVEEDRIAGGADSDGLRARRDVVESQLAALAALRRDRRRHALDHQLLGRGIAGRVRARSERYRRTYEREIAELTTPAAVARYADELPGSLDRTLGAAWEETAADIDQTVRSALGRYLSGMGADPAALGAPVAVAPVRSPSDLRATSPSAAFDVIGEGLPAAMMAGGAGFMAYNALGLAALGIPLIAPLALGGLLAGTLVAHRRRVAAAARNRTALTKALGDAFAVATTEMCLAAEQAVAAWRADAEDAVDLAFGVRQKELDTRRKALETATAREAAERRRSAAAATERLQTLTACAERARALDVELAAAVRATSTGEDVVPM